MVSCLSPLFSRFAVSNDDNSQAQRAPQSSESTVELPPYSAPRSPVGEKLPWDEKLLSQDQVESVIDELDAELRTVSLAIHDHPEIAWKEKFAHDTLSDLMEKHGFTVKRHAYGLDTAFEAVFQVGKGGKVIGFNSELDALPGIGHACGHPLIAIIGAGSAIAVARALQKAGTPGKVILLGTPAEEADGGKINLIDAGAYKEMDICLMAHPAPGSSVGSTLAITELEAEYTGHTAHAAAFPWEGINAQDAAVLAYTNVSALRQQIKPTHRVHGIIINENWVQNGTLYSSQMTRVESDVQNIVIPGTSKIVFGVRAPTVKEVDVLLPRIKGCFEGAAQATGCTVKYKRGFTYKDLRQNGNLAGFYQHYLETTFDQVFPPAGSEDLAGSTDFGNVTYEVPGLHPMFAIPCKAGEGNHTVGFTKAASTPEAHKLALQTAKGLAVTAWKVVLDEEFAKAVKKEFMGMKK